MRLWGPLLLRDRHRWCPTGTTRDPTTQAPHTKGPNTPGHRTKGPPPGPRETPAPPGRQAEAVGIPAMPHPTPTPLQGKTNPVPGTSVPPITEPEPSVQKSDTPTTQQRDSPRCGGHRLVWTEVVWANPLRCSRAALSSPLGHLCQMVETPDPHPGNPAPQPPDQGDSPRCEGHRPGAPERCPPPLKRPGPRPRQQATPHGVAE